jgi:DNA-binding MarR family transcriptional regulator
MDNWRAPMHIQLMARPPRTPADRIAAECHSLPLRLLHRVLTGVYDDALRPHGLRVSQLNILVAIARMAGDATAARIGSLLLIEKSTLSRDLDRMLERQWIETTIVGRSRVLQLTKAGRRLLDQAFPAWQSAQSRVQALFGRSALSSLADAADRIRDQSLGRR